MIFLIEGMLPKLPFIMQNGDNEILLTILFLKQQGHDVRFISKDLNARVKADVLGIEAQNYISEQVSEEEFYSWVDSYSDASG